MKPLVDLWTGGPARWFRNPSPDGNCRPLVPAAENQSHKFKKVTKHKIRGGVLNMVLNID
jgi:hypothetical protein